MFPEIDIPNELQPKALDFLWEYITPNKKQLFEQVLNYRTRHVTMVLEDINKSQNANATLRTCEALGVQDIHVIENEHEYGLNKGVLKGSFKWITINQYNKEENNTIPCLNTLKSKGYKIVGTSPLPSSKKITDIDVKQPIAFVFGTEQHGLSETAINACDELVHIPMYGFTESFNISVSAAIILNETLNKVRASKLNWRLTEKEIFDLKLEWSLKTIKRSDVLVTDFLKRH